MRTALLVSALLLSAAPSFALIGASDTVADPAMSGFTVTNVTSVHKFADGYIFQDLRAKVTKDGVYQGAVNVDFANGAYTSLWVSQGLAMRSLTKGATQEWDVYAGWYGDCLYGLTCHAQVAYFMEPTLFTGKSDIVRLRGEISKDFSFENGSASLYAGVDGFMMLEPPQTATIRMGGTGSHKLTDHWSVEGSSSVAYDTHPRYWTLGYDAGFRRDMSDYVQGVSIAFPHVEGFAPLNGHGSEFVVSFTVCVSH